MHHLQVVLMTTRNHQVIVVFQLVVTFLLTIHLPAQVVRSPRLENKDAQKMLLMLVEVVSTQVEMTLQYKIDIELFEFFVLI